MVVLSFILCVVGLLLRSSFDSTSDSITISVSVELSLKIRFGELCERDSELGPKTLTSVNEFLSVSNEFPKTSFKTAIWSCPSSTTPSKDSTV